MHMNFSKINTNFNKDFFVLKLLEQDEYYIKKTNQHIPQLKETDILEQIIKEKYNTINDILECQEKNSKKQVYGKSKIDNYFLKKKRKLKFL